MKLQRKIALRYIFSKRRMNAISIIAYLSIAGIAIGTAALIIVMSIFNGFRELTEDQMTSCDPHIRIEPATGMYLEYSDSLAKFLENQDIILDYEPSISGKAIAVGESGMRLFNIRSYTTIDSGYYSDFFSRYIIGSRTDPFNRGNIYLGFKIADEMKLQVSGDVELYSPVLIDYSLRTFRPMPKIASNIAGLLYTNVKNYDDDTGLLDYATAKRLFNVKANHYSTVEIRLDNKNSVGKFESSFYDYFSDEEFSVLNWMDLNDKLLAVMKIERISTFMILGLIIMIAVFNILTSITMTVLEKQQDISLLRALGATRKFIGRVYLNQGVLIGIISTAVGLILGLGFCKLQIDYKIFRLDTEKYIIDSIPIALSTGFVVVTALFSFTLSVLAAVYPSYRASKTEIGGNLRDI
jgi:lipoprotein-releasing system permease protein